MVYTLPFLAAFLGWFTNYLAVKMLFHPREPINLGFMELQGVFPKRQKVIAQKLGKMVVEELFSAKDLREKIVNPANIDSIMDSLEAKINHYLDVKFPQTFPFISMVMPSKTKLQVKDEMLREVELMTPELIERFVNKMESELDIEAIVSQKVGEMSSERLEGLINSIISKEFRFIEIVGAIIGFMIGCLQIGLMWLGDGI